MALLKRHIDLFREVLDIPGFVAEPFLMIGFQRIVGDDLPPDFAYPDLKELLRARGLEEVAALDHFDPKANLRYDLNLPVPEHEHERYRTVYDGGTIEHVFDTRQCLENGMRMVKVGGHYFIRTPVRGYLRHGLHTFHPDVLVDALAINNFEIVYRQFSARNGRRIEDPEEAANALLTVVGRKTQPTRKLKIPQQGVWADMYGRND